MSDMILKKLKDANALLVAGCAATIEAIDLIIEDIIDQQPDDSAALLVSANENQEDWIETLFQLIAHPIDFFDN